MEQLIYEVRVLQNILAFGCFLLVILLALFAVGVYYLAKYVSIAAEHHETVRDAVNKKQ
jgi:high-affinity Fe2+/Pb2+ permease